MIREFFLLIGIITLAYPVIRKNGLIGKWVKQNREKKFITDKKYATSMSHDTSIYY